MIREFIIKISDEIMEEEIADRPQELVRCKDCRLKGETDSPFWDYWCNRQERNVDREWFCADGERRDGAK